MRTKQQTLIAFANQLAEMDRELALSSSRAPSHARTALARKLHAAGEGPAPFGFTTAEVRRLEALAKRENQLIRADLQQFQDTPVAPELAQLRVENVRLAHIALGRPKFSPFAIRPAHIGAFWMPQSHPIAPFEVELTPPAETATPANTSSAAIGELNLRDQNSGMGGAWGLLAAPTRSPIIGSLRFAYTPTVNASVYASAQVDVAGTVYAVSHDHWYTSAEARATVRLGCNLFHKYLDAGAPLTIADEHHTDSSAAYWLMNSFMPSASTVVEAGTPLIMEVWAAIDVYARSDHALVDVDFFTGADHFIRVPRVTLTVVPL